MNHVRVLLAWLALALSGCASLPPEEPTQNRPATSAVTVPPVAAAASSAASAAIPVPVVTAVRIEPAPANSTKLPDDEVEPPPQTVDPMQPGRRLADDRSARLDLWQRIRDGYSMPNLDTPAVRSHEKAYQNNRDYVQRMTERGGRYLFHIVEEVQRRKMPTELALLPFIESAFNPQALSSASASGIWQFMPQTGRHFDLKQNVFRDDRRDVVASTDAALDYLGKLYAMFGDWHLALAAYNWGEGNVRRAILRNRAAGQPTDYLSLRMPNETRGYVPKFQAIKNLVGKPEDFGLSLPALENHPYFLAVTIHRDIDIDLAARLAKLSMDEFKSLNPQLNKPVIFASGTPQILLPYDNANTFVKALGQHKGQTATWTAWTLPSTMKSADAAQRVGMSDEGFRTINHIPPRMLLKAGSTVLAPRGQGKHAEVSGHLADTASMTLSPEAPPQRKIVWTVGKRAETVAAVAKRHQVSATQVAQWNSVRDTASFAPGTRVTLFVPTVARSAQASPKASRAKARVTVKAQRSKPPAKLAQNKSDPRR